MSDKPLDYRGAGVDIDAGGRLVDLIKPISARTKRREVLGGLGGFGALVQVPLDRYRQPVLVSGTDGVGTKLKLAMDLKKHDTIGIDLVAMCVNDIVVSGAEPLFFLDYYATGKLNTETAAEVITGIGRGCELAGAALVGGETAEMPGMYHGEDYDLAGFCVGIVEKDKIIDGSQVQVGDVLLGLASSGVHSNGFSLVRHILKERGGSFDQPCGDRTLGAALLEPTRIYVKSLLPLMQSGQIHAAAHITGGGLPENVPRVLPDFTCACIQSNAWQWPEVFRWLQKTGNVATPEMYRTFNCGIGMVLAVAPDQVQAVSAALSAAGETVYRLGEIVKHAEQDPVVQIV